MLRWAVGPGQPRHDPRRAADSRRHRERRPAHRDGAARRGPRQRHRGGRRRRRLRVRPDPADPRGRRVGNRRPQRTAQHRRRSGVGVQPQACRGRQTPCRRDGPAAPQTAIPSANDLRRVAPAGRRGRWASGRPHGDSEQLLRRRTRRFRAHHARRAGQLPGNASATTLSGRLPRLPQLDHEHRRGRQSRRLHPAGGRRSAGVRTRAGHGRTSRRHAGRGHPTAERAGADVGPADLPARGHQDDDDSDPTAAAPADHHCRAADHHRSPAPTTKRGCDPAGGADHGDRTAPAPSPAPSPTPTGTALPPPPQKPGTDCRTTS